jgi:hypothetical protein
MNVKLNDNDATDDIFINLATTNQTDNDIKAGIGANTRKMPADAAAPFPPLNISQIGYVCPTIQQNAAKKTCDSTQKNFKNNTSAVPFNASISNVMSANFLFPVLKTFVAPVLFEPKFLRSIPSQSFDNRKPLGTDPTIYPITHATSVFMSCT